MSTAMISANFVFKEKRSLKLSENLTLHRSFIDSGALFDKVFT
jgi:hypothetical protein